MTGRHDGHTVSFMTWSQSERGSLTARQSNNHCTTSCSCMRPPRFDTAQKPRLQQCHRFANHARITFNSALTAFFNSQRYGTKHPNGTVHTTQIILKPRLHDTTCCQTGWTTSLTTSWMFVYTIQPVVSCKRGISMQTSRRTCVIIKWLRGAEFENHV